MAWLRTDRVQSLLFSAAVMLGACSSSSSNGNPGGQGGGVHGGGGGQAGSSATAGTVGTGGSNGSAGSTTSGSGGSVATGGTSGAGGYIAGHADAGHADVAATGGSATGGTSGGDAAPVSTGGQDASISQDAGVLDSASSGRDGSGSDGAVCVLIDGGSRTLCNGVCVDTQVDPMNCGGCAASGAGVSCMAGAACVSGVCQDVVGSLQGLRWSIPCTAAIDPAECDATSPAQQSTTVQGTAGVTYAVTLRFRGVVEQKTYSGRSDGGLAATGTNASFFVEGATPAGDGYNVYSLTISSPAQTAYLNSGASSIGHCWPIDYTVTLPMKSSASVSLAADTVDGVEITNQDGNGNSIVVPGIPPSPDAYNGQFIQMDVINVVSMP